jgi:hypothetical protein
MDDIGANVTQLRDYRYEAVVHMVTAADGAKDFYSDETNEARYESSEEAIAKDNKLR